MSGATPNAVKHASLPPMASRFVEVAALPWEKTRFAGVDTEGVGLASIVADRLRCRLKLFEIARSPRQADGQPIAGEGPRDRRADPVAGADHQTDAVPCLAVSHARHPVGRFLNRTHPM